MQKNRSNRRVTRCVCYSNEESFVKRKSTVLSLRGMTKLTTNKDSVSRRGRNCHRVRATTFKLGKSFKLRRTTSEERNKKKKKKKQRKQSVSEATRTLVNQRRFDAAFSKTASHPPPINNAEIVRARARWSRSSPRVSREFPRQRQGEEQEPS